MWSALYSNSLSLFGKGLVLSALLPVLFFFAPALWFIDILPVAGAGDAQTPDGTTPPASAGDASFVLAVLFVLTFTYILYGLRNAIQGAFISGQVYPLDWLRDLRVRQHQRIARRLDHEKKTGAYEVMQAETWFSSGMQWIGGGQEQDENAQANSRQASAIKSSLAALGGDLRKARKVKIIEQVLVSAAQFAQHPDEAVFSAFIDEYGQALRDAIPHETLQEIKDLAHARYQAAAGRQRIYPQAPYIRPTVLGNVFSCGDEYCRNRYGIQFGSIFPRLQAVIPEEYAKHIEDEKIFLDFAFNVFLLSATVLPFSVLLILTGTPLFEGTSALVATLAAGLVAFLASRWAYNLSVIAAGIYVDTLMSSLDLYRLRLLDLLRIRAPRDMQEEREFWTKIAFSIQNGTVPTLEIEQDKNHEGT